MQNTNDTFKILILSAFVGLCVGGAGAQIVPGGVNLPPPNDIDHLVNVGPNTQIKKGDLSVDTIEAANAAFAQDFYSFKNAIFSGVVNVGTTGTPANFTTSRDVFAQNFETGKFTVETTAGSMPGQFSRAKISDRINVGTVGSTPGEVHVQNTIHATNQPKDTASPWEDRLCLHRYKETGFWNIVPVGQWYGILELCPADY